MFLRIKKSIKGLICGIINSGELFVIDSLYKHIYHKLIRRFFINPGKSIKCII